MRKYVVSIIGALLVVSLCSFSVSDATSAQVKETVVIGLKDDVASLDR